MVEDRCDEVSHVTPRENVNPGFNTENTENLRVSLLSSHIASVISVTCELWKACIIKIPPDVYLCIIVKLCTIFGKFFD